MSHRLLVLGAGHIGQAIVHLLHQAGDRVTVMDRDAHLAQRVAAQAMAALAGERDAQGRALLPVEGVGLDVGDAASLASALSRCDAVINALPFRYAVDVAKVAAACNVHYFDLTEDVASTHAIMAIAKDARSVLMPQCGLAPGFIGVIGHGLLRHFDEPATLKLRVGALPRYPTNALRYNLTWSTEGLINEYCNPCEAIVDGRLVSTAALEGHETFLIDGVEYEAFNTSGGLGTLAESLSRINEAGKASPLRSLDYKSIRYPGHRAIIKLLLDDLGLSARRDLLAQIFEGSIPQTSQDVIVILASATGLRNGALTQQTWSNRVLGATVAGLPMSAIQLTTAAGICTALDLVREGRLPQSGFISQQSIDSADFLRNRFGRYLQSTPLHVGDRSGNGVLSTGRQADDSRALVV